MTPKLPKPEWERALALSGDDVCIKPSLNPLELESIKCKPFATRVRGGAFTD
jgi:hypothetical protein